MRLVTGLTDAQLTDYELHAELATVEALQKVADIIADRIGQIQVASGRVRWDGCPYGLHPAHAGPCTLIAADDVPDDGLPPGQPYVSPDDLASIPPLWAEAAAQTILPVVAEVWQASSGSVYAQMVDATNITALPSVGSLAAEQYLAQAANTFAEVGDDLWATARTQLLEGFEQGESIPQLAARVRGSAGLTAKTATLVARTQVLDASNAGSMATARASGLEMQKEWMSAEDLRVRPAHAAANGQKVDLAAKFNVGGFECDRPHDPILPPELRYSCRCTTGYLMAEAQVRQGQRDAEPEPPLPGTSGVDDIAAQQSAEVGRVFAEVDEAFDALGLPPVPATATAIREIEIDNRIRAAYRQVASADGEYVLLSDLRRHLDDLPRRDVDLTLARMNRGDYPDDVVVVPQSNQKALTQADRDAAVFVGGQYKHAIRFADASPRPLPPGGGLPRGIPNLPSLRTPGDVIPGGAVVEAGVRPVLASARTQGAVERVFREEFERITGRKPRYVDFPGSAATAREHAEGLLRGLERFPDAKLDSVGPLLRPVRSEYAHASGGTIRFNYDDWTRPARRKAYLESLQGDVAGWDRGVVEFGLGLFKRSAFHPRGTGNPIGVALHEFGHVLDIATVQKAIRGDLDKLLKARTAEAMRRPRPAGETPITGPDDLIQREISAYAASDHEELVAEAFVDVMINGEAASVLSRQIFTILEVEYRRGGMHMGAETVGKAAARIPARAAGRPRPLAQSDAERFAGMDLEAIARSRHLDTGPKVVTAAEVDAAVARGWVEVWRGVRKVDANDAFRTGELDLGQGLFGRGYYFSTQRGVAEVYRGADVKFDLNYRISSFSGGIDGGLLRVAINPSARVIDYDDLLAERKALLEKWRAEGKLTGEAEKLLTDRDVSKYAAARGYDVVRVRNRTDGVNIDDWPDQYVVINRRAVLVEGTPADIPVPRIARAVPAPKPLPRMTVAELRTEASARGVVVPAGARKADIVRLLDEAPATDPRRIAAARALPGVSASVQREMVDLLVRIDDQPGIAIGLSDELDRLVSRGLVRSEAGTFGDAIRGRAQLTSTKYFLTDKGRDALRSAATEAPTATRTVAQSTARQTLIDKRRQTADFNADTLAALLDAQVDTDVLVRTIQQSAARNSIPKRTVDSLVTAARSGDPAKVEAAAARVARTGKVQPLARTTDIVAYDPKTMQALERAQPGQKVRVVRPGHTADVDGERVQLSKSVVEVLTPAEIRDIEGRALRQAARERNRLIEARTGMARLLAEVDELISKGASKATIAQRLDVKLTVPEQIFAGADPAIVKALADALASGDMAKLRAAVTRAGTKVKIKPISRAGAKAKYDPDLMEPFAGDIPAGAQVTVVTRGSSLTLPDGTVLQLTKARVQPVPVKATKASSAAPVYKPPGSISTTDQARAARLVRRDPQIYATVQDRFGGISTSGNLSAEDAAWLQTLYTRERAFVERLVQTASIERDLARAAKAAGSTPAKFKAEVSAKLKTAFAGKPIGVRVSSEDSLQAILRDGRFKTQFEGAKRAPGLHASVDRRRLGEEIHGIPAGTDPASRPIYGYVMPDGIRAAGVGGDQGNDLLSAYGRIQVVLRPEVRARTTATIGDSLDRLFGVQPSAIDNPSAVSAAVSYRWSIGEIDEIFTTEFRRSNYVEAQINGGVAVSDIAEVIFPSTPSAATQAALERQGIPWRVMSR